LTYPTDLTYVTYPPSPRASCPTRATAGKPDLPDPTYPTHPTYPTYPTYLTYVTYPPSLAPLVRRELRRASPTYPTYPTYLTCSDVVLFPSSDFAGFGGRGRFIDRVTPFQNGSTFRSTS